MDGVRGLSALYVLLHHAYMEAIHSAPPPAMRGLDPGTLLSHGHLAVAVFIVLSGFSLMLPVARSRERELRGGILGFAGRRARRILPPYYAAIILCLVLQATCPTMASPMGDRWDAACNVSWKNVAGHVLLIHNLVPQWTYRIEPPMWFVATEWQIYFVFALVLLPVWRKFGRIASLAAGTVTGFVLTALLPQLGGSSFWLLGVFSLGMLGADLVGSPVPRANRHDVPWGWLAVLGWGVVLLGALAGPDRLGQLEIAGDFWVGGAALSLILWLATVRPESAGTAALSRMLLGFLASQPCRWLGDLSYSLYLVHFPVLALVYRTAHGGTMSFGGRCWLLFGVGTPMCLAVSWMFSQLFEAPLLRHRR